MSNSVQAAFDRNLIELPIEAIEASRVPPPSMRQSAKYKRIAQSISEIGIIEPLVVARPRPGEPRYLLLDGNLRFAIIQEQGTRAFDACSLTMMRASPTTSASTALRRSKSTS